METNNISHREVFVVIAILLFSGCEGLNVKYVQAPLVNDLISRNKEYAENIGNPRNNRGVDVNENAAKHPASMALQNEERASNVNAGGEILLPKLFPLSPEEPTCEQLRAMWIFSRRQSRASEITNEIPTYRDPFAYNVWEPYYSSTRSAGSVRMANRFGDHTRGPVFGRIVSREPLSVQRNNFGQRQRHFGDSNPLNRVYGAESKSNTAINSANGRRPSQYRLIGGSGSSGSNGVNSAAVQGSFQKLKELIWTERAKELTQQRRAEEIAARAAVLKEIASGQNIFSQKNIGESDAALLDENRSPDRDYQYMNDGRFPITNAQSKFEKNINKNGAQKMMNTRTFFNMHRPDITKPTYSNGRTTRLATTNSEYDRNNVQNDSKDLFGEAVKTYPMRPSYFRERNRMLFRKELPENKFERNTRKYDAIANENDNLVLNDAIEELRNNILANYQSLLLKQRRFPDREEKIYDDFSLYNKDDNNGPIQSEHLNYWDSLKVIDNQKY